jgi:Ulp1 family protease
MQNFNIQQFEDDKTKTKKISWFCDSSVFNYGITDDNKMNQSFSMWKNKYNVEVTNLTDIYCPVLENNSLMVVSFLSNKISYYSSEESVGKECCQCMSNWISSEFQVFDGDFIYVYEGNIQTSNIVDRGVFLLMYVYYTFNNQPLKFEKCDCEEFRKKIGTDILRFYLK